MNLLLRRINFALSFACVIFFLTTQNAPAADMTAEQHFVRGMSENSSGQYQAAVDDYTAAIKKNPQYWKAYANRSAARYNVKDYNGAMEDIKIGMAHLPPMKSLADLKAQIQTAISTNLVQPQNIEARRRAAQQMLLNAQLGIGGFGGIGGIGADFSDPAYQITQMAQNLKAHGRAIPKDLVKPIPNDLIVPMTGHSLAPPTAVTTNSGTSETAAANARLAGMVGGTSAAPEQHVIKTATKTKSSPFSSNVSTAQAKLSALTQSASVQTPTRTRTPAPAKTPTQMASATADAISITQTPPTTQTVPTSADPDSMTAMLANETAKLGATTSGGNNPAADEHMSAQQYFDRGCEKGKAMDLAGALKDYDECIRLNPKHGPAYANRASTRFNLGDHKGALDDFNKAVDLMPNNSGVQDLRERVKKAMEQRP
jgi:tetratricopeptide (TPR) repeat protein